MDSDVDGVCDPGALSVGPSGCTGSDDFANSNTDPTVLIDGCNSGMTNRTLSDCFTFNDRIGLAALNPKNHGDFVKQVSKMANNWKKNGLISGKDKGKITSCAARSVIA